MGSNTSNMPIQRLPMLALFVTMLSSAHGHGAMVNPAPRSSHNQVLDAHNDYGCQNTPGGCYSKVGLYPGEYVGTGCIGEACLYYQIGCFRVRYLLTDWRERHLKEKHVHQRR